MKTSQKKLWKNVLIMIGISIAVITVTFLSLNLFTRHAQSFIVPDFSGYTLEELSVYSGKYDFQFIIRDSIYVKNKQAGSILRQDPYAGATVKKGRKFYMTIVASTPESVAMPSLVDISLRQATSILASLGMIVGNVSYSSDGLTNNLVLAATYKGKTLRGGEILEKGSTINLRVSRASNNNNDWDQESFVETVEDDI